MKCKKLLMIVIKYVKHTALTYLAGSITPYCKARANLHFVCDPSHLIKNNILGYHISATSKTFCYAVHMHFE